MTAPITSKERSRLMARVRTRNTGPEIAVRGVLREMGYRVRGHRRDLPGTPDVVIARRRIAIFVHGCFWHLHRGCRKAALPRTRTEWWRTKLEGNVRRDRRVIRTLKKMSWRPLVIWECEVPDRLGVTNKIRKFLQET